MHYTETNKNVKMRQLYNKSLNLAHWVQRNQPRKKMVMTALLSQGN